MEIGGKTGRLKVKCKLSTLTCSFVKSNKIVIKMITESFQMSESQTNGISMVFKKLCFCFIGTCSAYFKGYMRRATSIPGQ